MAKIAVFVQIESAGSGSDSSIGLVSGNLQWCSATGYSGWASGMVDNKTIDIAPMTCNVTTNGGLGGFDGDTAITVIDGAFWTAYNSGTINLTNKLVKIWIGANVASKSAATLVFTGKTSSVSTPDLIRTEIICDGINSLDLKKIPSMVITQEMALNNPDSEAIGEAILPVFGNNVFYPMVYCKPSDAFVGFVTDYNGVSDGNTSIVYFNARAIPAGGEGFYDEILTTDLEFAKGKSILQCVGKWQSSETSPVWVCFSYNGKELLAADASEANISKIANAIIGKRLLVVHGAGKGESYKVTNVEWATHKVTWGEKNIETVWFELDTTKINDIKQSLQIWRQGVIDEGNMPLYLNEMSSGYTAAVNLLVGAYDDVTHNFMPDVSYFAFQFVNSGLFIVSADADTDYCEVYQKTDSGYSKVAIEGSINVVYQTDKWKMLSLELANEFGDDEGQFLAMESFDSTSYIYENIELGGLNFPRVLNSIGVIPTFGGEFTGSDAPISGLLTEIPSSGYELTNISADYIGIAKFQNTVYVPFHSTEYDGELNIRILPSIAITFTMREFFSAAYNIDFKTEVYVIGEGNIALAKKDFSIQFKFDGWGATAEATPELLEIDHSQKAFILSSNCVSHETVSKSAYALMESALTFSASEIPEKKRVLGFLVSIAPTYDWVAFNDGISFSDGVLKTIKPAKTYFSKKADVKNLWLKCRYDSLVGSPIGIVKSICETVGIALDGTEFAAVAASQRAFFSTYLTDFNGQYSPKEDESVSDIIDAIGKGSLTGFYPDASGKLRAKFLPDIGGATIFDFDPTTIRKNSLAVSTPKNGYLFSDYDFSIPTNVITDESIISIDTDGVLTFPSETETEEGSIIFNEANGYTVVSASYNKDGENIVYSVYVRGSNPSLFSMFIPGTIWKLSYTLASTPYTYILRLDNVAPDIGCPPTSYGIRLCMKVVE